MQMAQEQIQWYIEQCQDDAHQSCTYHSFVNIDQLSCSSSSHSNTSKDEQTWTLTRTMSHPNKRYQTAIENIRLAIPIDYELKNNNKIQQAKTEALFSTHSMRFLHVNGEIQVRI